MSTIPNLLQPHHTFDAKNILTDFHRKLPSDKRYTETKVIHYTPKAPISQDPNRRDNIEFRIGPDKKGGVIMLQDMVAVVDLLLQKKNGESVTPLIALSVVNNVVNSLFEEIIIEINGAKINKQCSSHHPYKSYVSRLLTFDDEVKQTQRQMGWVSDVAGLFDNLTKTENQGFIQRATWFCEHNEKWQYKDKPTRFSAPIDHDMASLGTGIPPGTTVDLTITQTSDKFRILTDASGGPYSLEIKGIKLLIPTRWLAPDIFKDLQISMKKEPAFLSFRQMTVDKYICQKNLTVFTQSNLFKTVPTKVIVGIVRQDALAGSSKLNPFK